MRIAIGTNRWLPWALGAFMAVGAAGCAGSSPSVDDDSEVDEATAAVQSDTDADRPGRGMRGHGRGMAGPGALFHLALGDLDLTEAQRTKIEEAMKTLEPPERGDRARSTPKRSPPSWRRPRSPTWRRCTARSWRRSRCCTTR